MLRFFFLLAALIHLQPTTAQIDSSKTTTPTVQKVEEVVTYYSNGVYRFKSTVAITSTGERMLHGNLSTYYPDGQLKDSGMFQFNQAVGTFKSYYPNGMLKRNEHYATTYTPNDRSFYGELFYKNGQLKRSGHGGSQGAQGIHTMFTKKGKPRLQLDFNRGQVVDHYRSRYKPYKFRKHPLKDSVSSNVMTLRYQEEKKTLRRLYLIDLQLKNDTTERRHLRVEGYTKDAIIVSDFSYGQTDKIRHTLDHDSSYSIAFDQIDYLMIASMSPANSSSTGFMWKFYGVIYVGMGTVFLFIPGAALGGAAFATTGAFFFYFGKLAYGNTIPKRYALNKWQYTVKGH
jgi:hypothetical protein